MRVEAIAVPANQFTPVLYSEAYCISTTRMINALHLFMTLSLKQLHLHPLPDRMDRWGGGGAGEYVFFLPKVHPSIWQSC